MKYVRFLLLPLWYLAMSCATQTTPQGGPKDTIPPTVVKYYPAENSKNFKGKQIEIEFNEALQLNNPKEEILIIPSLGKATQFKLKGNTLIIEPELPWRDSTTYNINFREGVKDLTEGNPAKDLRGGEEKDLHLAFSTGPLIDTLSISGTIKDALTPDIPKNITVALYSADTFDIFEDIPEYFTKSNIEGKFSLTNLKSGKYHVYAFDDKNKNLKVESRSEKFGFHADTVHLDSAHRGMEIALVNIDTRQLKLTSRRNQSNVNVIRFNKSTIDYEIVSDTNILSYYGVAQAEIIAYYPDIDIDSLQVGIRAIDSTEQILDTLIYIKRDQNERIKEKFTAKASDANYNLETNILSYTIDYTKPLASINHDSVYMTYDTVLVVPLKFRSMKIDTMFNRITVNEMIPFDSLPKSPKITFAPTYLVSVEGDTTKTFSSTMKLFDSPSTAVLIVEVQTNEPHFVIQLVNGANKVVDQVVDQKKITFKFLTPEPLKVRAIIDRNANGKWDTAIYPRNREPEKIVYYLNSEKKTETPLRANWEVGPLIFKF